MKPFIIPFFLTQQGCGRACLYCSQKLAGAVRKEPLTPEAVTRGLAEGLASRRLKPGARVEAAFYGGTFTMLPRSRQGELLEAVTPFLKDGSVSGLRLSTRPDALDRETIEFLKASRVTFVEIGAVSLDDRVLAASGRWYTAGRVAEAAAGLETSGLDFGLQLLVGLPAEDAASRKKTLDETLRLAPREVRLYPLLVLKKTPLARLFEQGDYRPLKLNEAVDICARMYQALRAAGIRVTRLGLHPNQELRDNVLAGPLHPAFGHLVQGAVFEKALSRVLGREPAGHRPPVIQVAPSDLSRAQGHGRQNLIRLAARFKLPLLTISADPGLQPGRFRWQDRIYDLDH